MRLFFAGDVMLGRLVNDALKTRPPEFPWGNTLPLFKEADARIINLECVISDRGEPWSITPKVFHFRTDAKNIDCLKIAGINAVSLANNHTLDFEYEAAFEMLNALDKAGIAHAGAGKSLEEASRPAFFKAAGHTIGMVSFTDNEPAWEANHDRPGVFYVPVDLEDPRAAYLFKTVKEAKKKAEILIVAAHWGPNWGYKPAPDHVPFAHALVESGADIIFGHSCHVFQGIEIYKGRPIIYSAGNFVDDYAVDEIERNDESFMFFVEAEGPKIKRMLLVPTMISRFQARLARGFLAEEIAIKMKRLCEGLGTKARFDESLGEGGLEITVA